MPHECYACSPANPDRVFSYGGGTAAARFPMRFNGPPGSANGGIAVGALACPALAAALDEVGDTRIARITARLQRAVVCDEPLAVNATAVDENCEVAIRSGEEDLIQGVVELAVPRSPNPVLDVLLPHLAEMSRAKADGLPPFFEETGDHPIPGCFSCGPENPHGMHIYPRVVSDGLTCAPWHASGEFDDGNGAISPMIVASALDCSSGICMPVQMQRDLLDEDRFFLLGSLDVHFLRLPQVERDYRIVAKALRRDGRKFFGVSAMFDDDSTPYATAEATWIIAGISRSEAFGSK